MIHFERVSLRYQNGLEALREVSLSIKKGEFVFIVGPTGSGKSSLLRLLYLDARPTEGKIYFNGKDLSRITRRQVPFHRRQMGVIFQDFKLLPQKNVWENIAFALEVIQTSPRIIQERVQKELHFLGLYHLARSYPEQLSGGEQQRVCLARAIVNHPQLLLADEPTGNLDPEASLEIVRYLERINRRGTTVIMATHDHTIVNHFRKRVVAIVGGRVISDVMGGEYAYTQ